MSDDHAYQTIGAYASLLSDVVHTPNIDRIAREGARLDNCFVTNSICTPSRAAILTGQYAHINGVKTFTPLDPKRQNVAKLLQRSSYQTAMIGKWHLYTEPTGFDYFNVLPGQGRYIDPQLTEKGSDELKTYKGHSTDVITDLSLKWLGKRDQTQPFFLMCHFKAAHADWHPPKRFKDLYKHTTIPEPANLLEQQNNPTKARQLAKLKLERMFAWRHLSGHTVDETKGMTLEQTRKYVYQQYMKQYLRCIAGIDENVGKLLAYLDKNGLTDNTVVIYTSDQGHFQGEHGFYDKRFMYEESLRMPFLIRYPKEIKPASTNADFVINTDFAPLFLDYAQQPIPADMQGRSFRKNLAGNSPQDWRTDMYYRYWLHRAHHGVPAHFGVRTKDHKLIFFYGLPMGLSKVPKTTPTWELYDLKNDPSEMNNVYNDPAYASVIKKLKQRILQLRKELKDTDENSSEMKETIEKYWQLAPRPVVPAVVPVPDNNHPLRIGMDQAGGSQFRGKIGRVTMFRGRLDPDAIRALAKGDRGKKIATARVVCCVLQPAAGDILPVKAEDLHNEVSFEAWILPEAAETGRILDKITGGQGDGFLLDCWPKRSLRLIVGDGQKDVPGVLKAGVWQHVAVVIGKRSSEVYLDGKKR